MKRQTDGQVKLGDTFFIGLQILEVEERLVNGSNHGHDPVKYQCRDLKTKKKVILSKIIILKHTNKL